MREKGRREGIEYVHVVRRCDNKQPHPLSACCCHDKAIAVCRLLIRLLTLPYVWLYDPFSLYIACIDTSNGGTGQLHSSVYVSGLRMRAR